MNATACRRLWSAVLLSAISDYNVDYNRDGADQARVIRDARHYLTSRDGRTVAALAGITIRLNATLDLIALTRAAFKARTTIAGEDAA